MEKRTMFVLIRNMLKFHLKAGDLSISEYEAIIDNLDKADTRILLESEE